MEWNPPQLSLPYPLQQGTMLCGVARAAGAEHLPACWTGACGTGVHPVQGSRCPYQCGSWWWEAHSVAPSFCNEKVVLNSHIIKSGRACAVLLPPGSEGVFWKNEQQYDVMIISIPSPRPLLAKYCGSVSPSLCYFTDNLRGKGFSIK